MSSATKPTVLILGAGINGCAVARELALNGVPVCIVERNDIAWGATSRSSRLIHGGLRYLEHGEFRLVRESLEERSRLRKLAPQFVSPFQLHIPVARRTGGLWRSALGFFSRGRWGKKVRAPRGLWLVRLGLWFYDRFVSDPAFPSSEVLPIDSANVPQVDAGRFRWLCRYTDAQMVYPERFVLSMLLDGKQLAEEKNCRFSVWTYHEARPAAGGWEIVSRETGEITETIAPALVINSTGAWGDLTLDQLKVQAPQLFGGTKGSHFVTHHPPLREAVGGQGVYAEADDGRLVFILPMAQGVMVGTTDERFEGNPDNATASEAELAYLVEMVNDLFPLVALLREHIEMHCA
jgi:glycerol-3-phosphate dehydrogenase